MNYALSAYPHASNVEPETAAEMHARAFREAGEFPIVDRSVRQRVPRVSERTTKRPVPPAKKAAAAFRALFE